MTIVAQLSPLLDADEANAFDAFVRTAPFAAYQQTRAWTLAAPAGSRRDWRCFVARRGDAIVGAAVIRCTRLAMGMWLAVIQRGPVVHDSAMLGPVLDALCRALRRAGACAVQIGPRVRGRALPDMAEAMRAHGFAPLPSTEQSLHHVTGIIWLDKPQGEILAGFKQRARRALRAAEKDNIRVRPVSTSADLTSYQQLLDAFAAARPDYDMGGQPDARGQALLVDACGGGMLLAERDGVVVGAHAFVRQADEAIWLSLATLDRGGASPGYPLLWDAMCRARDAGCIGFDLAGLPEHESSDPGEAGRLQFKSAFAPHRRLMPPAQSLALRPLPAAMLLSARRAVRGLRRLGGPGRG